MRPQEDVVHWILHVVYSEHSCTEHTRLMLHPQSFANVLFLSEE
jgi:hypothetical protein